MKRIYLIVFCALVGCSSLDIQVFEYSKTNSKTILLRGKHEVTGGDLENFAVVYTREIKDGQPSFVEIMMYFKGNAGVPDLKEGAILKIDDKTRDVSLSDRTSFIATKDADLVGLFGISDNPKILKGKITIPPDVEQMIKNAKNLEFVIYTGNYPTMMKLTIGQLSKIKEFLNYGIK